MAPSVWRIATDTPSYGADDLAGKGAEKTGGRWNRKGTPLIYASSSIALACLETLVHLAGGVPLPLNRYLVEITLPPTAWRKRVRFDAKSNVGWDAVPPGRVSMDWGTRWLRSSKTLLAQVPSIIVPEEFNILINPTHPDTASLSVHKHRLWRYR